MNNNVGHNVFLFIIIKIHRHKSYSQWKCELYHPGSQKVGKLGFEHLTSPQAGSKKLHPVSIWMN